VIILSTHVEPSDAIAKYINRLANKNNDGRMDTVRGKMVEATLVAKIVYRLSHNSFAVVNRETVADCAFTVYQSGYCTRGHCIASVRLDMDVNVFNEVINIGIIHIADNNMMPADVDDVVEWIGRSKLALLTGYFGNNAARVEEIAIRARATYGEPCAQWFHLQDDSAAVADETDSAAVADKAVAHPSYFLVFGFYRAIKQAKAPPLPPGWVLGEDLLDELIGVHEFPQWPDNDEGSTEVHYLGGIKTKNINFDWWCPHMIQTALWIGCWHMPSKSSQERQMRKGKGKGKYKGTGKGKNKWAAVAESASDDTAELD